jgi:hypothetical protein
LTINPAPDNHFQNKKHPIGCFFIINLTFNNKFRKTSYEMKNAQAVNLSILEIQGLEEAWRLDLM